MRISIVLILAVALTASMANAQDITTGLQGYWSFEEGGGTTTADLSGNGNTGIFVGTPEWDSGPDGFGNALFFDVGASGDGVDCGEGCNPIKDTGKFSFAHWAYWKGTATSTNYEHQFLLCKGYWGTTATTYHSGLGGPLANEERKNRLLFHSSKNSPTMVVFPIMPKNEWVHLVFTFDGSNLSLYMNGAPDGTGPHPFIIGTPAESTGKFVIGENFDLAERSFDGYLDEVRVYNRVLSEDDILALMQPGPGFNSSPRVDAGSYQSVLVNTPLQLDATATDDGRPYQDPPADPCTPVGLTLTWSKLSGPGTVVFSDTTIEDPTATFSAAGMYELRLRGYDGEKDACDVVNIFIRPDDNPIAHWDFETGSGTNVVDRSVNNNFGTFAGEPNWVDGWIGNWALECSDNAYVNITVDSTVDPNLDSQEYEITVATWLKVDSWLSPNWNGIVTKGDGGDGGNGGWSLIRNSSSDSLSFYAPTAGYVGGSMSVRDGYWHHVAAVHDGITTSLYVDGVLDASAAADGFLASNTAEIWINGNSEYPGTRFFAGQIDDVRIYSYGLSAAQIADLAAMGSLVPVVDAGADQMFSIQDGSLQLDGTVTDDGNPVAATIGWSKTSGPGDVVFSDTAIEDPTATFPAVGTYVLRLTADDTTVAVYDEVTITVENPTCQDVIDDGLLLLVDFSGPEGVPDCYIDLYDFAAFAGNWLYCNNPQDPDCENPF